ncbi:LytR/AlgR family response regulator transcription factor [Massilia scottii]|uniref:LytR/AlgR family response regulator transcription factor n=1 Tax=Massilia scottii TaxID=3057166 RepID=UPI002796B07B|nr:LytTR family transcriptional regulator DNA-binding domain-containing protein [Massilia sp. CCM 9029]MDQ1832147.1 LytTR family transcriptional regulator DNA-binding domain-containing protein [Massilia sp. CCM 9029]
MRVIIVDDEDLARGLVREFLSKHADIDIMAECANGFDAVKAITELEPDLVFLDIQMPKLNGFEVVELAGAKARYIFVTAFDQYALKAFDIHAVDYLLKPFSQQRLDAALAHARTSVAKVGVDAVLREAAQRNKPLERVLIRDGARVHIIAAGQIDYIEAQDDYVRISAGGKHYLKNQRLSELESQLDPALFVRIHRSWLLNLGAIERIEQGRDSHTAILRDGTRLPVSRSGYQKVRALIG